MDYIDMGRQPPHERLMERLDRMNRMASGMLPSEQSRAVIHLLDHFHEWRQTQKPNTRTKPKQQQGGSTRKSSKNNLQLDLETLIGFAMLKYSVDQYKRRNASSGD